MRRLRKLKGRTARHSALALTWLFKSHFRKTKSVDRTPTQWVLSPQTAEMLVQLARDSETEVCGLIYGNRVVQIANVSEEPGEAFLMDPDEQKRVMIRNGPRLPSAIWHSHPSNSFLPSGEDVDSLPGDIPSVIVLPNGRIGVWLDGVLQSELEGVGV